MISYLKSPSVHFHFFTSNLQQQRKKHKPHKEKDMATEQLNRRDDTTKEREIDVEKERVPQLTSHFEAIADPSHAKATIPEKTERIEGEKPVKSHELAAQFESLADKVRDNRETDTANTKERSDKERIAALEREQKESQTGDSEQRISEQAKGSKGSRQNQPSLEEICNYRATAQEKSNEAIRAVKERNDKANKESVETRTGEAEQRGIKEPETGLETVKETLTSVAKTTKDYTAPIAEKAKDYTVQKAVEAKDMTLSAGQTTTHYLGEKAVAAKDAAIESGKVAAEYAGKAAEDLKDKAVVAGWSTAHYSCDAAVEGTKAAARLVKGAAEYAGAIAARPLSAAREVTESTGESIKDYTARKKEEAQRESMHHKEAEKESMYEKTKETLGGAREEVKERGEGKRIEEGRDDGGTLGAIGETLQEIAQTTKEIVIGAGDETGKQSTLGLGLGQEDEGEEKGQGYEKEHYQTATRKEHTA